MYPSGGSPAAAATTRPSSANPRLLYLFTSGIYAKLTVSLDAITNHQGDL